MNTTEATILDIKASPSFRTATSISFSLSRRSKSLCPERQVGWIDVHFPCVGHIKTQVRVLIPEEYLEPAKMATVIKSILAIAGIPEDETYEATFVTPAAVTGMSRRTD